MKSINSYYTSVTEQRWFCGHRFLNKKQRITWLIDSTSVKNNQCSWKISVSEAAPDYGVKQPFTYYRPGKICKLIPSYSVTR